jgi:DNA mismatch endonuclease, patch repair protein
MSRKAPSRSPHGTRLAKQARRDTKPERQVAAALRVLGLGYRKNVRGLPGKPDFANRSKRWVIFVHGCFWHRHTGCSRATSPKSNPDFWSEKFAANRRRDAKAIRSLRAMGFKVVVIWECDVSAAQTRLSKVLEARGVDVRQPVDH